uniref:Flp pilus assembly protein TadG n=1 Tax=Desulfovibrio sp. U5L TaxID=596152 RepID=I2Q3Z6_9BACT
MKPLLSDQRGIAAVEMAIGLLLLVPLLLVLVEATKALTEYSQLQNASMEGARMLARQNGDTSGVNDYIQSLFQKADGTSTVDGDAPTVNITPRDSQNNVTVQVEHAFNPFFANTSDAQGNPNPFNIMGSTPLTLSSKTVMALPAAN